MNGNKLLTTKEMAAQLGICPEYLNKVKDYWKIPYVRFSPKSVRYRQADVDKWLVGRAKKNKGAK